MAESSSATGGALAHDWSNDNYFGPRNLTSRNERVIEAGEEPAITVTLPRSFNAETMYPFIARALDIHRRPGCDRLCFDFHTLKFIEPVGVVVLSNLIQFLKRRGVEIVFRYHRVGSQANRYLDDAGFLKATLVRNCLPAVRYARRRCHCSSSTASDRRSI